MAMEMKVPTIEKLHLPDVERVVFESTPLALAICQVRFTRLLSVADGAAVAPFQRAIQKQYPNLDQVQDVTIAFPGNGGGPATSQPAPPRWRFSDLEGNWSVVLAQDFLAIDTRDYERFEDFIARLRDVLVALVRHLRPPAVTRVGLRYINEIRAEGGGIDWSRVIRGEVLGLPGLKPFSDYLVQSVRDEILDLGGGEQLRVRHGVLPGGTTVELRPGTEPPTSKFFLLDFDASRSFNPASVSDMTAGSICRHVENYHSIIHRLFRWFLTDSFTKSLGVRDHGR